MGNTPIFGYPYPEDSDANDVHTHLLNLATKIETEQTRQGALEDRPPAGIRGRMYFATTWKDTYNSNTVTPWNVLYRDNGTTWVQLNDSLVQTYLPVWSAEAGAPYTITLHGGAATPAEYQIKAGGKCWVNINQQISLSGSTSIKAIYAGIPVNASSWASAPGIAQSVAEIQVNADLDVIQFHSGNMGNGNLWVMGTDFWFRTTVEYRV